MNYAESLAQTLFNTNQEMDTSGEAVAFLDKAFDIAIGELGIKQARAFFHGPDFAGDLIDAYIALKKIPESVGD